MEFVGLFLFELKKLWLAAIFTLQTPKASRRIAAALGVAQGSPVVNNIWIPDGSKDLLTDRASPRKRLEAALDEIFAEPVQREHLVDTVESKLFGIGIGSEAYAVGSHAFYMGHFHPTVNTLPPKKN